MNDVIEVILVGVLVGTVSGWLIRELTSHWRGECFCKDHFLASSEDESDNNKST